MPLRYIFFGLRGDVGDAQCGKLDAMRAARAASRRSESGRDLVPVKAAGQRFEFAAAVTQAA